jgi:hypothetical protein
MEYAQFIAGIKALRDEGTQLFGREQLHEDRQFRKWRHELTDLISRISYQGYPINCQVSARSFDQHASPDTHRDKKDRIAAYDRDLLDTINELDTLIKRYSELGAPTAAHGQSIEMKQDSSAVSKFQEHWLVSMLAICAVVATSTWAIEYHLFVAPRDFEIQQLREALARPQVNASQSPPAPVPSSEARVLLSYVGVAVGSSITTSDGNCTVRLVSLTGANATIEVMIGAETPQVIERAPVGRRTVVRGKTQTYYIDLHRERGNMVDLSVSSAAVAEQPVPGRAADPHA